MASSVQIRAFHEVEDGTGVGEGRASGVSWGAVIAGAFVTAALSLILIALGTGIGLSSGSLWMNTGSGATAVKMGAIIWLILVEAIASALGGYMAGRLRTKWVTLHSHEVYFRDTAHGFLAWSVALVVTAAFLGAAAASMAGSAVTASAAGAAPAADSRAMNPNEYFADSLFRTATIAADRNDTASRDEANLILLNGIRKGQLSNEDSAYLSQLVAARTGMSPAAANGRVTQVFSDDLAAATDARKAVAHSLYWLFVALLIGAFFASHAATIGGRQRDRVQRAAV
jgi:hypothetical protein